MPGMTREQIVRSHTYQRPHGDQPERYERIRSAGREFALLLKELTPDTPEQTLALRDVESAVMWANKSIAVNEVQVDG